jgi:hypothetical protein
VIRFFLAVVLVLGGVAVMRSEGQHQHAPGVGFVAAVALFMIAALLLTTHRGVRN